MSHISAIRRGFLGFAVGISIYAYSFDLMSIQSAEETNSPVARAPGETSRLQVRLEVEGNLKIVEEGKTLTPAVKVSAALDYDERLLDLDPADPLARRSARRYSKAVSKVSIDGKEHVSELGAEKNTIGVSIANSRALLFSPTEPLSRDELDLIEAPGNSLILDALAPTKSIAAGDTWEHSADLLAILLGLDAVSQSDVTSVAREITEGTAKVDLEGRLQGAVEGVSTEIELKGRYKFDFDRGRVTAFALIIKEKRSIGHVAPGMEITARLQVAIEPGVENNELEKPDLLASIQQPPDVSNYLLHTSTLGKYRVLHDRRWHVMNEGEAWSALRLVERGELIGQCNVTPLEEQGIKKIADLGAFQVRLRKALGKLLGQFESATEGKNESGQQVFRVTASGVVSEVPIRWHYYLISNPSGRQALITFTVEEALIEKLAGADEDLVSTFEFIEPTPETAAKPSRTK